MKLRVFLAITVFLTAQVAHAQGQRPDWITDEKLAILRQIGIDPVSDLATTGNYRWRYTAKIKLTIGTYSCPVATAVDVSRTIAVVIAPKDNPCTDAQGNQFGFLKLLPDGAAEPMGQ
jgi:hypothetical protein